MKRSRSVLALIHFNLMLALVGGLYFPVLASPLSRAEPDRLAFKTGSPASSPALAPQAVPIAEADDYSTNEDAGPLSIEAPGVLGNDDPDSGTLTAVLVDPPANGTLTLNTNGAFTYTPNPNYHGPDSFTYYASDGTDTSAPATVTITVDPTNDPPVASTDAYVFMEDQPKTVAAPGVLGNDPADIDGDPLSAVLVDEPGNGAVVLNANGSFTYTPDPDYNGPDSFTYRANDGTDDSAPATVFITVESVNDLPVVLPDIYSTTEDTVLTQPAPGVLNNDTDIDEDPLTASVVAAPPNGSINLSSDGGFTYTPKLNFSGQDTFTYQVGDGKVLTSAVAVTLNVTAVNDAPIVLNDNYTVTENVPKVMPAPGVLANDNDPEGSPKTAILASGPANGTLTLNSDGSFTYTPNPQFHGLDSFTYRASDGTLESAPATVSLTVNEVDDKPITEADEYSTDEDTLLTIAAPGVLVNDHDPEGSALTAVPGTDPSHGSLTLNPDGSFTYDPNDNFHGTDTFKYQANDGETLSALTTVTLTITPVNDPPSQLSLSGATVAENQPAGTLVGNLSTFDVDSGDSFTYSFASGLDGEGQDNALFQINGNRLETAASLNYESKSSLSVRIRVTDSGGASIARTFTIEVTDENEAPQALPDEYAYFEDQMLTVPAPGVLGNDIDPEGDTLIVKRIDGPAHGTLSLNSNGGFSYTPQANYNGPDSFTYRASDGVITSTVATVTLKGAAINDEPIALPESYSTPEDTKLTVAAPGVLVNDTDVEKTQLSAYLIDDVNFGTLVLNANGSFEYTPNPDYHGPDSFSYYASDGALDSETVTVTLTVTSVNDPINANDDSENTPEDTPITVDVLENDDDKDRNGNGGRLSDFNLDSLKITQPPSHGSASVDKTQGTITYNPAQDYVGTDSLKYEICDKGSPPPVTCDTATLTIDVGGVNDTPIIVDDIVVTDEDTPIIVYVLANDTDPDGFGDLVPSSLTVTTQPVHGTYQIGPTPGSITYSPNRDFHGIDSLVYQVKDQAGAHDSATLTITVNSVNDVPIARGNIYTIYQGDALSRIAPGVLGNDNDFDGDPIQAILDTAPLSGTLTLNSDGSFLYLPDESFAGADTFTYVVTDGKALSDPANVNITIIDTTLPRVQWLLPVEEEGTYFIGADSILLEATASDNVAVDYVRFYRWQPIPEMPYPHGVYIDICLVRLAPYSCKVDPTDLHLGQNQVFVTAFDKAGNLANRSRIILLKQDDQQHLERSLFLPRIVTRYSPTFQ